MSDEKEEKSFWRTLPGILTGIAAIITAITGLIIALNAAGIITIPPIFPTPTPTPTSTFPSQTLPSGISPIPTPAKTILPSTPVPTSIPSSTREKFLAACFPEVSKDMIRSIESGTVYFALIDAEKLAPGEPMVIELTEFGNPIGYIKFLIFKDNQVNKIEKAVDPNCQVIEEYSSYDIYGNEIDKHILGDIKIKFGNDYYRLFLRYGGTIIHADFNRI